jgi:hypothetical protein
VDLILSEEGGKWIVRGIALIIGIISFRWIVRLYGESDGRRGFSLRDFQKLAAFKFFFFGSIYILYIESTRTTVEHKFDAIWLAFMITGLFSVLHMDDVINNIKDLLELMIKLRVGKGKVEQEKEEKKLEDQQPPI